MTLSTAVQVVGDGRAEGVAVGKATTSLVAFHGSTPTDQCAAMTAASTAAITIADAAGSATFSFSSVTSTTNAWGFASQQNVIDLLYLVKNNTTRLAEIEAMLEEKGICAAN